MTKIERDLYEKPYIEGYQRPYENAIHNKLKMNSILLLMYSWYTYAKTVASELDLDIELINTFYVFICLWLKIILKKYI